MTLEPRYSLLTVAYLLAIYWLSSIPDLTATESDPLVLLLSNLAHVPLFAGLAFCFLKSLSGPESGWARPGLAFVASGTCAVLDEWHQAFIPGRHVSIGDLFLDLAGIGLMLLFLSLRARDHEPRNGGNIARLHPRGPSMRFPSVPLAVRSNPKVSGTGASK